MGPVPRNIDIMIQSLEDSIHKAQAEEKRLNERNQAGIPLPVKDFLHNTLNKFGIPGLNVEAVISNGWQFIEGIKKEFRENPKKTMMKIGVGIVVAGIVLKTIRKIRTSKEKRRHE